MPPVFYRYMTMFYQWGLAAYEVCSSSGVRKWVAAALTTAGVHFIMLNFMLCEFHLHRNKKKCFYYFKHGQLG